MKYKIELKKTITAISVMPDSFLSAVVVIVNVLF